MLSSMGKFGAGNNSEYDRNSIPIRRESPYFQAEGDDLTDLALFVGQFNDEDGEFKLNEYWADSDRGFQSETLGPTTGKLVGGAIGERLDEFQDAGYNISVYNSDERDGYDLTAAASVDFPRSFAERLGGFSPEIDSKDGGLTLRGNLNVSGEDLYEAAKEASLQEVRVWPRIDSALRQPLQTEFR